MEARAHYRYDSPLLSPRSATALLSFMLMRADLMSSSNRVPRTIGEVKSRRKLAPASEREIRNNFFSRRTGKAPPAWRVPILRFSMRCLPRLETLYRRARSFCG